MIIILVMALIFITFVNYHQIIFCNQKFYLILSGLILLGQIISYHFFFIISILIVFLIILVKVQTIQYYHFFFILFKLCLHQNSQIKYHLMYYVLQYSNVHPKIQFFQLFNKILCRFISWKKTNHQIHYYH